MDVGNLISASSAFSKSSLNIWYFLVPILLKPGLEDFEHYFASMGNECNCVVFWTFFGIALIWDWNENWHFPVLGKSLHLCSKDMQMITFNSKLPQTEGNISIHQLYNLHLWLYAAAAAAAKSPQSCPTLCDPIDGSHQATPSLGFSRQEYWSGLPLPSPMHESEKWKRNHSVVSDSQRPHGLQPTRLLHPWDFPGKSTGVGCHCLLQQRPYGQPNSTFSLPGWYRKSLSWSSGRIEVPTGEPTLRPLSCLLY